MRHQIAGAEPSPHAAVALQHQLAVAAVGDRADAHAHLLADVGHREHQRDEGDEEAEPVLGAVGGVGDHARTVVLAEHREDSGADEQPQQAPAPTCAARVMDAAAVLRARALLRRQRGGRASGERPHLTRCHRPAPLLRPLAALSSSTRIARRERAADRVLALAEAHEERPAEGLAVTHPEAVPGRDPAARPDSGASPGRSPRRARTGPHHPAQALHPERRALLELQVGARDRVAVGIDGGIAELRRDQRLEVLGEDVLEDLRLGVHAIPGHPQRLAEVALEQAMMADDLDRDPPPVGCQADAAVGGVGDQPELSQPLEHRRDRSRRDRQALGESVRRDGLVFARLEGVDRLRVVLDGRRADDFACAHELRIWHAKIFFKGNRTQRRYRAVSGLA